MFALGALHGGGHDIPMDRPVALQWFLAAAALGHPTASLMAGRYLRKGLAGAPDPVQAEPLAAPGTETRRAGGGGRVAGAVAAGTRSARPQSARP